MRNIRVFRPRAVRRWLAAAPAAIVTVWLIGLNHLAPPPRAMDAAESSIDSRARVFGEDDRQLVTEPEV